METQQYIGQILGSYNGEPILLKSDVNGHLIISPLPLGTNDIGQVLNGFKEVEVLPSSARTVSGNSVEVDASKHKEAIVFLNVTASSGTSPTLDVKFQTQDPISLKWFDVVELNLAQKTTVGSEMKAKANLIGSKLRCVYTLGGTTPSFTFSVGLVLKS